ncbi:helix-turn-helix domain-containing protein [Ornithinimicrobium sp. F0845]|uniref:nSTAND1 domain-containing NTPase n=1 Tax=Ornithinimicrobium sp. F0845 TaxID=2926412 RepID=UPI001FF13388|nr:helix-turn-helix domain-containing protein [Ornithinimicrobium sp. F0845]MCK0112195.1 helix-turn-helix domain-containing protein [Ornithinimicrobium sp. F0845]
MVTTESDQAPAAVFGEALTTLRLRAGLSVRELSRQTGVPSGTLGGYFSGRHLPPANRPEVLESVVTACGATPEEARLWHERLVDLHQGRRVPLVMRAPYRGLAGFGTDDGDIFFGRTALIDDLVDHVERARSAGGIVTVVGASGTGKSSLLRAGLIPALQSADQAWHCELITPGTDPAEVVETALDTLEDLPRALLVVDQFEELFTLTPDDDERSATLNRLVSWAQGTTPERSRVLVIGLRADRYGEAAAHPGLLAALRDRQVLVPPMTEDELRSVIEGPAGRVGLKLEWGLVDVIVSDLQASDLTHVLPHLSHTLQAAWEHSDRRQLRIRDYKAVDGVVGAVRRSAERAFADLDAEGQQVARAIVLRLIVPHPDARPSRRTRRREELTRLHPAAGQVLDHLIAHRLLTVSEVDITLSHEALISTWPRLQRWLDEDRADLLLREQFGRHERTWVEHDRDPELLLRGSLLEAVRTWTLSHDGELNQAERTFLHASEEQAEQQTRDKDRNHRRTRQLLAVAVSLALVAALAGAAAFQSRSAVADQRDEARSRQMARVAANLRESNVPLANQVALGGYQISDTRESRSALIDATSLPVMTRRVDPGAPLAAAANAAGDLMAFGGTDGSVDLVRVDGALMTDLATVTLDDAGTTVQTVALDEAGAVLAVGGGAEAVRLFDVSDPEQPELSAELATDRTVFDLVFSPDGRWLVGAGDEDASGQARVLRWERVGADWVERTPVTDVAGSIRGISVDGSGERVAGATMGGHIYLWSWEGNDLAETDRVHVGDDATRQFDVDLSPDGSRLAAVGSDKTLRLFGVTADGLEPEAELADFESWVNAVSFTTDGEFVVAGSSDSTLRMWEVPEEGEPAQVRGVLPVSAAVTSVDVVDEDRMVITTTDTSAYLWHLTEGVLPLSGDTVFITAAAEDGSRALTSSGTADGRLYLWDTAAPRTPRLLAALEAAESQGILDGAAAISTGGGLAVSGTSTGHLLAWDVSDPADPEQVLGLQIGEKYVEHSAFFAGDSHVVAATNDGLLSVVDLNAPGQVAAQIVPEDPVVTVAGSRRAVIATGGVLGGVHLWDGTDLEAGPVGTIDVELSVFALDFTSDGNLLAVGGANSQLELYDVSDPSAPVPVGPTLTGPAATVYSVAFSPDGNRVAAAVLDETVWVWHKQGDAYVSELVLRSALAPLTAVGWVDDDHLLAGGQQGRAYTWLVDAPAAEAFVCETTGTPATEREWSTHLPGIDYAPPCLDTVP